MDALAAREAQNAHLDERAGATVQQAEQLLWEQTLRLEAAELVQQPVGGVVLEESGEAEALLHDEPPEPAGAETEAAASAAAASGAIAAAVGVAETELGDVTKLRLQAARLMMLEEESVRLRSLLDEKTAALNALEKEAKEEQQQRAKLERSEKLLRVSLDKEKKRAEAELARSEGLDRDLAALRKETDEASKSTRAATSEQKSKDVRLNRALEELERYRAKLRGMREDREGAGQGARAEAQRLASENNRLRKRQAELLLAFRKQARLIDVLKRQKLHAEAAQLLSFTEEEFTRTLELGEALA